VSRRPIDAGIHPHGREAHGGEGVSPDAWRDALSRWCSTVTIVAVRDGTDIHATTVTSFFPVSADPPLVALSLGPSAQVLPWLKPGARFVVSLLSEGQGRIASDHADAFPVGPSPFPDDGDPLVAGALEALVCTVDAVHETGGGARIVVARVVATRDGAGDRPLLYYRRAYGTLAAEG